MRTTRIMLTAGLVLAPLLGLGSRAQAQPGQDISNDLVTAERISYSWLELGYSHSEQSDVLDQDVGFDSFYTSLSVPFGSYVYIIGGYTYGVGSDIDIGFDSYSTEVSQFYAGLGIRVPFLARSDFFVEAAYVSGEYTYEGPFYDTYSETYDGIAARLGYRERLLDWLYLEGDISSSEVGGDRSTGFGLAVYLQGTEYTNWVFSYSTNDVSSQFGIGLRLLDLASKIKDVATEG